AVPLPEDHAAFAAMGPAAQRGEGESDEEVRQSVAVEVSGAGHARIGSIFSADDEAAGSRFHLRQLDRFAIPLPEDDVYRTVLPGDEQIGDAVAVDIAHPGDAAPRALIGPAVRRDQEPALAPCDVRELDALTRGPAGSEERSRQRAGQRAAAQDGGETGGTEAGKQLAEP